MFPNGLFKKSKNTKDHYFGLFLKGNEAVGFVFEVSGSHLLILNEQHVVFSNGWENVVQDVDDLLFNLEHNTKLHLKETIFFVYSYFIEDATGEIKQPYRDIVKNLLKSLELKALGYIECFEAVASYLNKRDKAPLNAIIIELDRKNIDLCVYKNGRRLAMRKAARTDNLIEDLTAMLSDMNGEVLPSRMVLYDSQDLHRESAVILAHEWKDVFVQQPRVEIVQKDRLYRELGEVFVAQLNDTSAPVMDVSPVEEAVAQPTLDSLEAEAQEAKQEVMGFMIGEDVAKKGTPYYEDIAQVAAAEQVDNEPVARPEPTRKSSRKKFAMPKIAMPAIKGGKAVQLAGVAGLMLIMLSLALMEYFFHKASLTVYLPSKTLDKQVSLSMGVNASSGDLPELKSDTYTTPLSATIPVSGKRDIGEKARGEVMIHNFDDHDKSFSKGTTISADGRNFILDQDVTVASASEQLVDGGYVKQPGKGKAVVVAAEIGPGGNMAKGKRFAIADLSTSSYFAVNDNAFAGGTKKQIQTVSRQDIEDLKKSLTEKAKKDGLDAVKNKLGDTNKLMDDLTDVSLAEIKLSKELGEEAKEVTMNAQAEIKYYYYDTHAMQSYLGSVFKQDAPQDFKVIPDRIKFTVSDVKQEDDAVTAKLSAQAVSVKEVNPEGIAQEVKGQPKGKLEGIIKQSVQASGYQVDISSPVFFFNGWMPFFKKNIDVKTTSM